MLMYSNRLFDRHFSYSWTGESLLQFCTSMRSQDASTEYCPSQHYSALRIVEKRKDPRDQKIIEDTIFIRNVCVAVYYIHSLGAAGIIQCIKRVLGQWSTSNYQHVRRLICRLCQLALESSKKGWAWGASWWETVRQTRENNVTWKFPASDNNTRN